MVGRAMVCWLAILVLAIANGAVRQALLIPRIGERFGHLLSTVMLSVLVLAAAWVLVPWIQPESPRQAWAVGGLWLIMTLTFEFLAGHFLFGHTWERLVADYDITEGRIWVLVLLTTLLAPVAVYIVKLAQVSPAG